MDSDEIEAVYKAAVLGEPDPIGTDESRQLYADCMAEIEAHPDMEFEIPAELPTLDD